jgi:hypothetical protein
MSAVAAAAPMPASPQSNWLEEEGLAVARLGAETAGCELGAGPDTGSAWINLADAVAGAAAAVTASTAMRPGLLSLNM